MAEEKCLFCEIIKGNIPSLKVFENEGCVAVLSIKPVSKGHILILPKNHYSFIGNLPDDLGFHIIGAIKALSTILTQVLMCSGLNIVHNVGGIAGQKVNHVCFEIIPRYADDKIKIDMPEGKTDEDALYEQQKLITSAIRDSTVKLLEAIKEGKIEVSKEVKEQALKALEMMNKDKPKLKKDSEKSEKVDLFKLEDELEKI
ncbi:MAG: HIT family protein [Candidatus Nanoarchaeia archaeon]|nr:HIT family protein [Candidatus Nanoarchaeia archaeon]MDD5499672.1 HIT family protein [Candidatus Nanoarchaeia archaeon]